MPNFRVFWVCWGFFACDRGEKKEKNLWVVYWTGLQRDLYSTLNQHVSQQASENQEQKDTKRPLISERAF